MILISRIGPVAQLLLDAALSESAVSFKNFHDLFDVYAKDNDKYDTLEAADRALGRSPIYSALLSKASTGCPGSGFFDIFRNVRPDEYRELAGECIVQYLTLDQMQSITWQERQRVYEHAKRYFGGT